MMAKAPRGLKLNIGLVFEKAKENISHIGLSSLRSGGGVVPPAVSWDLADFLQDFPGIRLFSRD